MKEGSLPLQGTDPGVMNAGPIVVQCPLCAKDFPVSAIEAHASGCRGAAPSRKMGTQEPRVQDSPAGNDVGSI